MNTPLGYNTENLYNDRIVPPVSALLHATAAQRMEPAFFIIGVQKGGTTSLYYYLQQHPQVITPQNKDVYFFNNTLNYNKGIKWYKAHFAHKLYKQYYQLKHGVRNAVTFDATPDYFDVPAAPARLHKHYPEGKLILLLRNPIKRAYSCYQMARKFGFENLSFEEALALEEERLRDESKYAPAHPYHSFVYERLTYKKRGVYINYIKEWKELFGDKLLVLRSEDMAEQTQAQLDIILDFLGLDPYRGFDLTQHNKGKYEQPISPATYEMLKEYYEPYNQQLYDYLGRDMGWK